MNIDDIRELRAERRNMVRRLTLDGMSILAIAALLGCDRRTVDRDRKALRIVKTSSRQMTEDEIRWAKELASDGCPVREIAETLGRHPDTIHKYCRGMLHLKSDPLRNCRKLMKELDLL